MQTVYSVLNCKIVLYFQIVTKKPTIGLELPPGES